MQGEGASWRCPRYIRAAGGLDGRPAQGTVGADRWLEGAQDDPRFRAAIGIAPGDPLSLGKTQVQSALRRIYELGEYDDVRLEAVPLRPAAGRRPPVHRCRNDASLGEVVIHGGTVLPGPELENAFHATSGAKYDPAALVATRTSLVQSLRQKGYQDATLSVVGERATDGKVDICIDLREGNKVTLDTISFNGLKNVKEEELKHA